jgi:hypothetical protein
MHTVENPRELKFLAKSVGAKAFFTKLPVGPVFGFYCIFINKFFKLFHTPCCVHLWTSWINYFCCVMLRRVTPDDYRELADPIWFPFEEKLWNIFHIFLTQ